MVDGEDGKVPGEFGHVPVLLNRADDLLGPAITADNPRGDGAVMIDATLGLGGHSEYFLRNYPGLHLIGLDRDPEALRIASGRLAPYADRTTFVHTRYDGIVEALGQAGLDPVGSVHAILFDLGVSSMQLDEADRGFAYSIDAPLDMRMNPTTGITAAEVLNTYSHGELARILSTYGEERFAGRIASEIVRRRQKQPFTTSAALVELLYDTIPAATRRTGDTLPSGPSRRCGWKSTANSIRCATRSPRGWMRSRSVGAWCSCRTSRSRIASSSRNSLRARNRRRPRGSPWSCRGWVRSSRSSPVVRRGPPRPRSKTTHERHRSACGQRNESRGRRSA